MFKKMLLLKYDPEQGLLSSDSFVFSHWTQNPKQYEDNNPEGTKRLLANPTWLKYSLVELFTMR